MCAVVVRMPEISEFKHRMAWRREATSKRRHGQQNMGGPDRRWLANLPSLPSFVFFPPPPLEFRSAWALPRRCGMLSRPVRHGGPWISLAALYERGLGHFSSVRPRNVLLLAVAGAGREGGRVGVDDAVYYWLTHRRRGRGGLAGHFNYLPSSRGRTSFSTPTSLAKNGLPRFLHFA